MIAWWEAPRVVVSGWNVDASGWITVTWSRIQTAVREVSAAIDAFGRQPTRNELHRPRMLELQRAEARRPWTPPQLPRSQALEHRPRPTARESLGPSWRRRSRLAPECITRDANASPEGT